MEKQMQVDNVQRRESDPRLSRQQMEDAQDADRQAQFEQSYEHHLRVIRTAIQLTPVALVDRAFLGGILDSLGVKAIEAGLAEIGEQIEVLACEVTA